MVDFSFLDEPFDDSEDTGFASSFLNEPFDPDQEDAAIAPPRLQYNAPQNSSASAYQPFPGTASQPLPKKKINASFLEEPMEEDLGSGASFPAMESMPEGMSNSKFWMSDQDTPESYAQRQVDMLSTSLKDPTGIKAKYGDMVKKSYKINTIDRVYTQAVKPFLYSDIPITKATLDKLEELEKLRDKELEELDAMGPQIDPSRKIASGVDNAIKAAIKTLPYSTDGILHSLETSAAGFTIGAAVGIETGPGAFATGVAGGKIGALIGTVKHTADREGSAKYIELIRLGVPQKIARQIALTDGYAKGIVEAGSLSLMYTGLAPALGALMPAPASKVISVTGKETLRSLASRPIGGFIAKAAQVGKAMFLPAVSETAEELVQLGVDIQGLKNLETILPNNKAITEAKKKYKESVWATTKEAAGASLVMGFVPGIGASIGGIRYVNSENMRTEQAKITLKVVEDRIAEIEDSIVAKNTQKKAASIYKTIVDVNAEILAMEQEPKTNMTAEEAQVELAAYEQAQNVREALVEQLSELGDTGLSQEEKDAIYTEAYDKFINTYMDQSNDGIARVQRDRETAIQNGTMTQEQSIIFDQEAARLNTMRIFIGLKDLTDTERQAYVNRLVREAEEEKTPSSGGRAAGARLALIEYNERVKPVQRQIRKRTRRQLNPANGIAVQSDMFDGTKRVVIGTKDSTAVARKVKRETKKHIEQQDWVNDAEREGHEEKVLAGLKAALDTENTADSFEKFLEQNNVDKKTIAKIKEAVQTETAGFLLAHIRPQRIFEELDRWEYNGPWAKNVYNIIKKARDAKFNLASELLEKLTDIFDRTDVNKHMSGIIEIDEGTHKGTKLSIDTCMAIYAHSRNAKQRQHLRSSGLTDVDINNVISKLTLDEKNTVDSTMQMLDQTMFPKVNATHVNRTGTPLNREPFYFPIVNLDIVGLSPQEMIEMTENGTKNTAPKSGKEVAATKHRASRTDTAFSKLSFYGTLGSYLNATTHYVSYAEALSEANRFLSDPRSQEAIQSHFGNNGGRVRRMLDVWMKDLTMGTDRDRTGSPESMVRFLRTRISAAVLSLNVNSIARQGVSFFQGAHYIGMSWARKGLAKFTQDGKWAKTFAEDNSEIIKNRSNLYDREVRELFKTDVMKGALGPLGSSQYWMDKMLFLQKAVDGITTRAIWYGAYNKTMETGQIDGKDVTGNTHEAAKEYADYVVGKTQPMGDLVDLPDAFRGGEFKKNFTVFMNQLNQNFNIGYEIYKKAGGKEGTGMSYTQVAKSAFIPLLVPSIIVGMINRRRPPTPKEFAIDALAQVFGGTLFLGAVLSNYPQTDIIRGWLNKIKKGQTSKALEGVGVPVSNIKKVAEGTAFEAPGTAGKGKSKSNKRSGLKR